MAMKTDGEGVEPSPFASNGVCVDRNTNEKGGVGIWKGRETNATQAGACAADGARDMMPSSSPLAVSLSGFTDSCCVWTVVVYT